MTRFLVPAVLLLWGIPALDALAASPPNFIIIFTDDQGYNDLGCFGSPKIDTPNIDRLAAEGMRFTNFYSAASVCTPSRAALMTGCYPERVGNLSVLFPWSDRGLNPDEITIAEMLKTRGYATACVGKWHLGHHAPFLPTAQGFDSYFGIPYSNDMGWDQTMLLADAVVWREGADAEQFRTGYQGGPPLMRGTKVVEWPVDQRTLTKRYTKEAIKFIRNQRDKPFFLYLPHTMPHIPLYASDEFRGTSDAGLYGDTIEEIDWSVGQIVATLRELGLAERTMIVYTSDNGPWNLSGNKNSKVKGNMNRRVGGSAYPLRGFKFTKYEGGMREPTVMWWPERIPAGKVCDEIAGTIDILPTIAQLAGAKLPANRILDGRSIVPLLEARPDAKTPHDAYFYRTMAVRSGDWKLIGGDLYNLADDIAESNNVAADHPEIAERLEKLLEAHRGELRQNSRPAGRYFRPLRSIAVMPGWRAAGGTWLLHRDVLRQRTGAGQSLLLAPAEKSLTDGVFSVDVKADHSRQGPWLIVRARDSKNHIRWSLGGFNERVNIVQVVENGNVAAQGKGDKRVFEKRKWYRCRVEFKDKTIRCFVDNELVNELTTDTLSEGTVGIGTDASAVEFRNIRVTDGDGNLVLEALGGHDKQD